MSLDNVFPAAGLGRGVGSPVAGALTPVPDATASGEPPPSTTDADRDSGRAADTSDPCADQRTALVAAAADAERLQALARAANERLVTAHQARNEQAGRTGAAIAAVDPAAVRAAKDLAQARYRRARDASTDRAGRDRAVAAWLQEINEINLRSRNASALLGRATGRASDQAHALALADREADQARLVSLRAAGLRAAARAALADCEERERLGAPTLGLPIPPTDAHGRPGSPRTIGRLVQGDHATMDALVEALAGGDEDEHRRWQLLLADLVDAIVSRAIEAISLEFPEHHVLWSAVPPASRRDVAVALAALGFRFDGFGGFVDGRVPSRRDLSIAVSEAGLEQRRLRPSPADADLPLLYRNVRVDAAGFVAATAGGLTLGEMVDMLGERAEPLAELWNAWGRIRPLLADH